MNKWKLIIRKRRVAFPTLRLPIIGMGVRFPINFAIGLPSIEGFNLGSRTKTVVFSTVLLSMLVIAGAVYFAIRGIYPAPNWPEAAVYDAGRSQRLGQEQLGVGEKPKPSQTETPSMTLQLNIGGARISEIVFRDMSIGKASGLTDAIKISASSDVIICETLELINVEATDFTMGPSTAYSLQVASTTADGLSISPTLSSDPIMYQFGSDRGALSIPEVSGGTFDRIIISSSATSTVGVIRFENVKAYGAGISIGDVNCGEVIIRGTDTDSSIFGDGSGIDSASFTIGDDVKIQTSSLIGNIERPVSIK